MQDWIIYHVIEDEQTKKKKSEESFILSAFQKIIIKKLSLVEHHTEILISMSKFIIKITSKCVEMKFHACFLLGVEKKRECHVFTLKFRQKNSDIKSHLLLPSQRLVAQRAEAHPCKKRHGNRSSFYSCIQFVLFFSPISQTNTVTSALHFSAFVKAFSSTRKANIKHRKSNIME